MDKVAKTVGNWDVLILNAGYISTPSPVANARLDDYWKNYEVGPHTSTDPYRAKSLTAFRRMSNQSSSPQKRSFQRLMPNALWYWGTLLVQLPCQRNRLLDFRDT